MTQPFSYVDAPTLIGSWPILPTVEGGTPTIQPKTLLTQATILSIKREEGLGYDIVGRTFFLDVDATQVSISFAGVGSISLDNVIAQINVLTQAAVGADVAFRDNGFLRLTSPTVGEGSTLRIHTNPASSPTDVFFKLGLFSETTSAGGDLQPIGQIDPDRQVNLPGQLSIAEGETFDSGSLNRSLLQLAFNTDRNFAFLDRRKMAETDEADVANPSNGFILSGLIYTGASALPTEAELEDVVSVLRDDGSELVQERVVGAVVNSLTAWVIDPDTGQQHVTNGGGIFQATDPKNEIYVIFSGKNYKIIDFVNTNEVIIRAVNPTTGADERQAGSFLWSRNEVRTESIKTIAIWTNAGKTVRAEQNVFVRDSGTIARVDKNNRIVITGGLFLTNGVVPSDEVAISGHAVTFPYSNNGTYRVVRVIDEETLELQGEDYGPILLNPVGTLGSMVVSSNGNFTQDPFVELSAVVAPGTYKIVHKKQSTLREMADAKPDAFASSFSK